MNPILDKLLPRKKILITCGSGGVGKTTIAAALAVQAAMEGKKAIVLTIDPAKRLANSLGLDQLADEPQEIKADMFPQKPPGSLSAMMVDTKRTFDRVVIKYSHSPDASRTILNNRLYQYISNMLAGSQEYMAMEKLYEIAHDYDYDLIVLDTPPTRHALDFIEAPKKMINIISDSILKWFLSPTLFASKAGINILRRGSEKILSVFDRLAGFKFLHELSEMLLLMSELLGGFQNRAQEVYKLLRQEDVGFLLVTTPQKTALEDAFFFYKKIQDEGLPFAGFIINRVHPNFLTSKDPYGNIKKKFPKELASIETPLLQTLDLFQKMNALDQRMIQNLKKETLLSRKGPQKIFYKEIPFFSSDIHDIRGLIDLNQWLANPVQ